ncbi:ABC transporter permease [Actinoplanes sp. CA-131856]
MRLLNAELFKLRTTSIWWIMLVILVPLYAVSLLINWAPVSSPGSKLDAVAVATTFYTTGQYVGVLIVMLLAAIVVTSEFFHLTATSTFLVTPRRAAVVGAKFGAAAVVGALAWLGITIVNLVVTPALLHHIGLGSELGRPAVWRAIGLNLLAFVLWAILGTGVGVLIRSQLGATLTLSIVYVVGTSAVTLIFNLLSEFVAAGLDRLQLLVPTSASQLLVSGIELPGDPPRWAGAVVMIGYAVVAGAIGTVLVNRRDIT